MARQELRGALMGEQEWWGVAEAASHCRIQPGTWRDYVARGRAPAPDDPDEGAPASRRRPRWKAETVRAWQASRPGKGGRPKRAREHPRGVADPQRKDQHD